jgi:hypothetical protein
VIPHQFLSSPSTNTLNADVPVTSSMINYPSNPLPAEILSEVSNLSGYDYLNKTYIQIDSDPYINTFGSEKGFYIKDLPLVANDVIFDDTGTGQTSKIFQDVWGRSFIWHSAFKIKFSNGVTLQDPGIYVRNDSNLEITVNSAVNKTTDLGELPFKYFITYTASQSNGLSSSISNARIIRFIDAVAPAIDLSPNTDGTSNFILLEGGTDYGDSESDVYTIFSGIKQSNTSLSTSVIDAAEGYLPQKLVRSIYLGIVTASDANLSNPLGKVYTTNPITDIVKSSSEVSQSVSSIISTSYSDLNQTYTIKYEATDTANNVATPSFRYLVVKDTLAPTIATPVNQTLVVDYTSTSDPNVLDEQSIKDHMVADLVVTDPHDYEPSANFIWNVTIQKPSGGGYDPGIPFPAFKEDAGYTVTITSSDTSGNVSNPITRYLKVGDTMKPVLTMMGKDVIHDFLRFATNANMAPLKPATYTDEISLNEYNSSGFGGGEHRMLLADYNFVDPGVYAEDYNSTWSTADSYPDLDGDGIGEGYALVKVDSINKVSQCSNGPGIIHVYSHFEEQSVALNSKSLKEWQTLLESNLYGFPTDENGTGASPAKIPKVWNSITNTGDHNFTDPNKANDVSTLTNLDMTVVTINYRVKDGWDNFADPMSRTIYIYESNQYEGYAFYATPLTDINGNAFEDYDNNGSTGNPSMSAARKDTDGDGVSDFWEFALNTNFKDPLDKPDLNSQSTFINNPLLTNGSLLSNLSRINAASRLVSDVNITATQGL